ncbi:hypothetical protein FACS1894216_06150 [Synergistales bacterium]|nr:hypothetical protein FACS1894216_06150 [Synergistales bacterium]
MNKWRWEPVFPLRKSAVFGNSGVIAGMPPDKIQGPANGTFFAGQGNFPDMAVRIAGLFNIPLMD